MKIIFNTTSFAVLTFAFMLFTIIGTLSHEYGHIVVAKQLGYDTTLHYGSMNFNSELNDRLITIYNENETAIENDTYFEQKKDFESGLKTLQSDALWILVGGPSQTILTGLIGLTILFFRRKHIKTFDLKTIDWLAIFLSLFWLREVFNLVMSIVSEIISPNGSYFSGDEKNIAYGLNIWEGSISVTLGIVGLFIALFVIFRIIPKRHRLTFLTSGLTGGIIGFIVWMYILGPKLLP
ncbi:MAG TPA: hypothetical protein VFM82_06300 [Flavobacteriaceae bacterium]|nr:hypothetical protein [Flavobacteriaceae bacterium]